MRSTFNAFLDRGITNKLAASLVAAKLTLKSLQMKEDQSLTALGLTADNIADIRNASRPPIPSQILEKLLYESRETCCVCQRSREPIVIHHIDDWAKSHSHDETNLVVVCPNDHARAHLPGADPRSLSQIRMRGDKAKWKLKVETLIRNQQERLVAETKQARWFWVNLQNLATFTARNKIQLRRDQMPELVKRLRANGFIDGDGNITAQNEWKTEKEPEHWFLDFKQGADMATYLSDLLDTAARKIDLVDLNLFLDSTQNLREVITTMMHVAVRADFHHQVDRDYGKNAAETHMRIAEARVGHTLIRFGFDSWYGLSNSSKGNHLRGRHEQTVIGQVTSCNFLNDEFVIELSALGISADFDPHHPSLGGWVKGQK